MLNKYVTILRDWYKNKINDIKWYIVDLYMHTWLWTKIGLPAYRFKNELDNLYNKEEAFHIVNKKRFKYVPKSYKLRLINEKFK